MDVSLQKNRSSRTQENQLKVAEGKITSRRSQLHTHQHVIIQIHLSVRYL
jgi:hypothetical protein